MNLLNLLTNTFTTTNSTNALSAKTGLSSKQIRMVLLYALPLLIKAMTKNANSSSGATSLFQALTQHKSTKPIEKQIEKADSTDGSKILSHILGSNEETILKEISEETNMSTKDVTKILSNVAPSLLSSVSAATNAKSTSLDLSDMMGIFSRVTTHPVKNNKTKYDGTSLLNVLQGLMK